MNLVKVQLDFDDKNTESLARSLLQEKVQEPLQLTRVPCVGELIEICGADGKESVKVEVLQVLHSVYPFLGNDTVAILLVKAREEE